MNPSIFTEVTLHVGSDALVVKGSFTLDQALTLIDKWYSLTSASDQGRLDALTKRIAASTDRLHHATTDAHAGVAGG